MDRNLDRGGQTTSTSRTRAKDQTPRHERPAVHGPRNRSQQSLAHLDHTKSPPSHVRPTRPHQSGLNSQNILSPVSGPSRAVATNSRRCPPQNSAPSLPKKDVPSYQPSIAPPSARSTLISSYDKTMASRQTKINSLPPKERQEQEEWAQKQLTLNAGTCVVGFSWYRIDNGYRCHGGSHMVTDELLAEGKGGCWCLKFGLNMRDEPVWVGPYYGDDIKTYWRKDMDKYVRDLQIINGVRPGQFSGGPYRGHSRGTHRR